MPEEAMPDALAPYYKKLVDLHIGEHDLSFAVSQSLFSSHQVDTGTRHLIRSLEHHAVSSGGKILDLGCGYGPIGLSLGALNPGTTIHMVDRDALAVAFARHNARRNEIDDVEVYGSLSYEDVAARKFDLIASNIPGKAGEDVIQAMLNDARYYLAEDGTVAVVVVTPLEDLVKSVLAAPDVEIIEQAPSAAHAVFLYRFTAPSEGSPPRSSVARGLYDREDLTFVLDDLTLPMQTARGLREFDTLSYATELLIKMVRDRELTPSGDVAVFNPGQGHIPVILWQLLQPQTLTLTDRDLLSLRYTEQNLIDNGCPKSRVTVFHSVGLIPEIEAGSFDVIAGVLREDEGTDAIEASVVAAAQRLRKKAKMVIAAGSTPITRLLSSKDVGPLLQPIKRKRSKGRSVVVLQRK